MIAFLDTNVVVRHLTGEPVEQARRAKALLADARRLLLTDLIAAEIVFVLSSVYGVDRVRIVELLQAVIGFPAVIVLDRMLLLRALELYEHTPLHFADAYLVASAELSGLGAVASFDRAIDGVASVRRIESV